VRGFSVECMRPDRRPAAWLQDIVGGHVFIRRALGTGGPPLVRGFGNVRGLRNRSHG
jgi:hypothetical protein